MFEWGKKDSSCPFTVISPRSRQSRIYFLFLWICHFWTFRMNGIFQLKKKEELQQECWVVRRSRISAWGGRVGVGTEETRFLVRISLRLWQDSRKGVTHSYSWVDSTLLFLSARAYHTPSLLKRVWRIQGESY